MKKLNRFQPRNNKPVEQNSWTPPELPFADVVAIYARRSDPLAIKKVNTSNEMQTSDLVDYACRLGWTDDKIIVFAQDMGRSGKLRIDQREGLRALVNMVEEDIVKTVLVFLEDRLFRDETQIQVNVFIDICRQHNCIVITPHMTYDFHNRFHVKQFRWRCEEAADYLKDYIQARLVEGKHRIARRGQYTGGGLPPGFIVDRREKILFDGLETANPMYRKYLIYESHAQVVVWLFDRYMMLAGNLTRLCKELNIIPVLFSDFDVNIDQPSVAKLQLRKVPGGYHITRRGLISILTNTAYLGWWSYQGEVLNKINHPAIVDEDVFWYAFNRLADYAIDGKKNEHIINKTRYEQNGETASEALLKDIIGSQFLGAVYVIPAQKRTIWYYAIYEKDLSLVVQYHSAISAAWLDHVFVDKLLDHLRNTSDFTHYRTYVKQVQKVIEQETVSIKQQLTEIDNQSEGILITLKLPATVLKEKTRNRLALDYEVLQETRATLEAKLTMPEQTRRMKTLIDYYDLIEKVAEYWNKYPFEDRKTLVEALTEEVLIDVMSPHWMRISIKWRIPAWEENTALIWRIDGLGGKWTEEENNVLQQHYPTDDRASIMVRLPHRSWQAITFQANQLKLKRSSQMKNNSPISGSITVLDWQFMQEQKIVYDPNWQRKEVMWLESDKVEGITSFMYQLSDKRRQ